MIQKNMQNYVQIHLPFSDLRCDEYSSKQEWGRLDSSKKPQISQGMGIFVRGSGQKKVAGGEQ
jgi:hypothetical protein